MSVHSLVPIHTDRSVSRPEALLPRIGLLAYGLGSYLLGVTALVAVILASLGFYPFTGGPVQIANPILAGLFNLGLLLVFGLQHSVMARAAFKRRWIRIIHPSMERSTYVLATGAVLLPLVALWQPLPAVVWSWSAPIARDIAIGVSLLGWAYLLLATFAIDHFELFGLQQSWRGFRGQPPAPVPFRERWMYRIDRHPIMTGVLVGLWAAPDMTLGRLLYTAGFSVYILVGVFFEERALRRQWGDRYESYRRRVPTLIPTVQSLDELREGGEPTLAADARGSRASEALTASAILSASPERAWESLADVVRWHEWLSTMTAVEPLDSATLVLGARYRIFQPRLRPAIWTVVGLEPRRSFAWESRSLGVRTLADHRVTPLPGGTTRVTLRVRFSGPLALLARRLAGSLTREYLNREVAQLKQRVEASS